MSDAYYDVAIVGTELSGLITGAMLAKKGLRVVVLGHNNQANTFDHNGHKFVRRPWLFTGLDNSPAIKKVLIDLALSLEMQNRPTPFNPFYQVVLPGKRIDVVAKETLYQREIQREFGTDMPLIREFYERIGAQNDKITTILTESNHLPPSGFFEERTYKKLTEGFFENIRDPLAGFDEWHPFRAFAMAPLLFGCGFQCEPYSPVQLTRYMAQLNKGLFNIEGGIDSLKSMFIDRVKSNCGDYRSSVTIDRFIMKRGRVREIRLLDRGETIGCDAVICNLDIKKFFGLIPEEEQKQRFHLKIHELQPSHYLYTVNFAMAPQAAVAGMGRHVFVVGNPGERLEDHNVMLLCTDPAGLPESNAASRTLSATVRLRARNVRPSLESIEAHDKIIVEKIKSVVPFFEEHLIEKRSAWVHDDRRSGQTVVDPAQMIPIYNTALKNSLDTTPIACRTAYKNVLVAGDQLHAGLGFEGAFFGAQKTVTLASDIVTKKSLLN